MKARFVFWGILFVIITAGIVHAQDDPSVDVPFIWGHSWGVAARAAAMGGAYTAVADDYAAMFYNPAGLGQQKRLEISATISYLGITERATFLDAESDVSSSYTKMNALGISIPVPTRRGSLVLGFGYHQVRDFERYFIADRFLATPYDSTTWEHHSMIEGGLNVTSLGGSVEMAPGLFVGGSINFWTGKLDDSWKFQEVDEPYDLWLISDTTSTETIRTEFSGANVTLAMLYRANDMFRFGATIQTPVTLTANEEWEYYDIKTWDWDTPWADSADVATESGGTDYKIRSPWVYRLGGSLNMGPLLVSGDVEFYNYGQISYRTDPPIAGTTRYDANIEIREKLRNVINWSVGGELSIPGTDAKLRGGYAAYPSPWKEDTDIQDRKVISFGAGYTFNKQFMLDVAYAFTSWDRSDYYVANSYDNDEYRVNPKYVEDGKCETYKFLVSLSYRM